MLVHSRGVLIYREALLNSEPDFFTKRQLALLDRLSRADIEAQEILVILDLEGENNDVIKAYSLLRITYMDISDKIYKDENTDVKPLHIAYYELRKLIRIKYRLIDNKAKRQIIHEMINSIRMPGRTVNTKN